MRTLLAQVAAGAMDVEAALLKMKEAPFEDLGFAKVDHHRALRQGVAEVIYGAGKTPEQIRGIVSAMLAHGQKTILITRMSSEAADVVGESFPLQYDELSRVGIAGKPPKLEDGVGKIVVATGGTSDMPVAEEAAKTAECLGNRVVRLYDVGVVGIHRLLANREQIMTARVVVAVTGMGAPWRPLSADLRTVRSLPFLPALVMGRTSAACRRFSPCSTPAPAE